MMDLLTICLNKHIISYHGKCWLICSLSKVNSLLFTKNISFNPLDLSNKLLEVCHSNIFRL